MKLFLLVLALVSLPVYAQEPAANGDDTSWTTLDELQKGNQRFINGNAEHERQDPKTRQALATGQKPKAIVLSCSDSRVPPETVFDQGLGDLFVVRIAGHALNTDAIASIEYAVEHLGARFIVVLGHDSCGAVKAAVAGPSPHHSQSLNQLVSKLRKNIEGHFPKDSDKLFLEPVAANVRATARELVQRSEIVQKAVEKSGLRIGQAVYNLESGRVNFLDVGRPWLVRVGGGAKAEKDEKEERKPANKSEKSEKKSDEKESKKSEYKKSRYKKEDDN